MAEHGEGLEVIAVTEGAHSVERRLHRRFSHLRTAGEWFEPGDDLLGFIVAEARPWDGSDEDPFEDDRVAIIHLKGTPAYTAWLDEANRKTHIPKAAIFRLALIDWAEKNGLKPPPEM